MAGDQADAGGVAEMIGGIPGAAWVVPQGYAGSPLRFEARLEGRQESLWECHGARSSCSSARR